MISVKPITPDEWRDWRALRQEALREAPSAFGSSLADWQGSGDTEERWRAREFNAVVLLDDVLVGMVSGSSEGDDPELISMWVAPPARGRGVGAALVGAVLEWARTMPAKKVVLRVMEGNDQASALYRRHGFEDRGPVESPDPQGPVERWMAVDLLTAG